MMPERPKVVAVSPALNAIEVDVALDGNGYANPLTVTAPVAPETVILVPATMLVTPVLVMVSPEPPTSAPGVPVKEMPVPEDTEEVATLTSCLPLLV